MNFDEDTKDINSDFYAFDHTHDTGLESHHLRSFDMPTGVEQALNGQAVKDIEIQTKK